MKSKEAENVMKLNKIGNITVKTSPHRTLNYSKGVISESEFQRDLEDLLDCLKDQNTIFSYSSVLNSSVTPPLISKTLQLQPTVVSNEAVAPTIVNPSDKNDTVTIKKIRLACTSCHKKIMGGDLSLFFHISDSFKSNSYTNASTNLSLSNS
ncbi:hypothetical protein AVEN_98675-1 [Araneus ventricosus]|uniref:Uncharacterized protein n=1 Tax=Araneus ventricosus TaxID=182803 RepID=A0A4Y2G7V9_ARAVE|nr:hypothetical protein AVEN_251369-1 [Araneus ventricosus]GBM49441.1 hypothetical protein AVEN_98675-1 [Araneus ventricosus]